MQAYSPFNKTIRNIQTTDLVALKQCSEGWYIEYKREMLNATAVAKSLSAFANTYGGWLFIGIDEHSKENPVAGDFPGLALNEIDATLQRIRKSVADLLNPSAYYETNVLIGPAPEIGLGEHRGIICVWVPQSKTAPHVHKSGHIYRRVSDASEPKPENDRFVLDQLWRRADEVKRQAKEWYDLDPEFSEYEKQQPYLRIMLVADRWGERDLWSEAEDDEIRSIFGGTGGISSMPFDTVHTSSDGFIARQLNGNDPQNLTLTWKFRRNLRSDVIVPLPLYQPQRLEGLSVDLNGYNNVERFIKILNQYHCTKMRVIDLNFILNILLGVALIQKQLCALVGWSEAYHLKIKVLNAWRTIPYVDIPSILEKFEKHGPPMCLDSVASFPRGTDPDSFIEVPRFDESENENGRILFQALTMFWPIAIAFGIPSWVSHNEGSTDTPYDQALQEAGHRAIDVQRRRIERSSASGLESF